MQIPTGLTITLQGEQIELLPECALWWPARQLLLIADIHFGKAATFRALGQPIPTGTTGGNLARLDRLLHRLPVEQLIFLGDFLHGPEARSVALFDRLLQWRQGWPGVRCLLVRGNHDRRAGDPPENLGITVVDEPLLQQPFAFCHEPQRVAGHHALAGHLHPAVVLRGRGRDRLRLPCFCMDEDSGILPAFGEFTGTWPVAPMPGRRIYAVGDGRVWAIG